MEIGVSLGSNLGDRLLNLLEARKRIIATKGIALVVQSPVYETEPVDVSLADRKLYFLNAVIVIESSLPISELVVRFRAIEYELGREPTRGKNAPRKIDLDIIYAGSLCLDKEGIVIPHPCWSERRFVVQPLNDVRPGLIVPGQTGTVAELLRSLPEKHKVRSFAKEW